MKTALVIGATGLVGQQCIQQLLLSAHYSRVIALTRKAVKIEDAKFHNIVVDFNRLDSYAQQIRVDDVYCTMGTTIAVAGSQAAFRRVDYEIPLQVAQMALKNGAEKFILVSSIGASAASPVFYSRVKGELEEALKALAYASLIIFRPSILVGNRKEKRTGEAIGIWFARNLPFLFAGPFKKYKGTPVGLLAKAMVKLGTASDNGVRIIENEEIFTLVP